MCLSKMFESVHSYESIPRYMNAVLKLVLIFAFDIIDISLAKCLYFLKRQNIVYFVICTVTPSAISANSIFVAWQKNH